MQAIWYIIDYNRKRTAAFQNNCLTTDRKPCRIKKMRELCLICTPTFTFEKLIKKGNNWITRGRSRGAIREGERERIRVHGSPKREGSSNDQLSTYHHGQGEDPRSRTESLHCHFSPYKLSFLDYFKSIKPAQIFIYSYHR